MRIYNTLSRQVEDFVPDDPTQVKIYTCGPTVYDYPHIGNWFTFIRYDTLVRTFIALNFIPLWVLNITDVGHLVSDADEGQDKLEKAAAREGKSAWEIADFYSKYFIEGLERLHITQPNQMPRATDHIPEQIDFIKRLESLGYTYKIDDGLYYDTSKFERYANFARLDSDEQSSSRIEYNPQKRNSRDFALWKFSPAKNKRDMEWDSPWGKGFPGWHIECSAMALKYLGETLDIHCGGIDHIPTHHTNEIAQTESLTNKPLSKLWMHANHITVDDQKISKSLSNGITLEDIEKNGFDLIAFRLHVLESHYRNQSKFSWDSLGSSSVRLKGLYNLAVLRWQTTEKTDNQIDFEAAINHDLIEPMLEDLNSPLALSRISQRESLLSESLIAEANRENFEKYLTRIDSIFGLDLMSRSDINQGQKDLISQRQTARTQKNWQLADELRLTLAKDGIGINDTLGQPIWNYL
jgi:cysteinyl-tRNA synthetase